MRAHKLTSSSFALCVRDDGSEDLEQRKIYQVLPDREAAREGHLRIVDESGEDYLYPSDLFVVLRLPAAVARRLMSATPQRTSKQGSPKLRLRASRA
jgi:hypothetical protein